MLGLMMQMPLLISSLLRTADENHGATEIVTRSVEGGIHRYTYNDCHRRTRRLANALTALHVRTGDRIATLAWNTSRHLEVYYAVSGIGAVCHTINPRLFAEQISYIVNHAEDSYLFLDLTFVPLVEKLAATFAPVKGYVIMTDRAHMPPTSLPNAMCYEDLLSAQSEQLHWPEFSEHTASSLCYTSGTTGNPKGVLYSHRSTVLHSYAAALPDALNLSARDVVLPVVPMFHANAWGMAYSCPLVGAKLVFPGAALDGASLCELFDSEGVTMTAGVPTVWLALLTYLKQNQRTLGTVKRTVIGGSSCPPAMIRSFEVDFGVQVLHAWGMTEMSPLGTVHTFKAKHAGLDKERLLDLQAKQGRAIFGVEMKIVDGEGKDLPHDGKAFGDLLVRGPWVCAGYFKGEGGDPLRSGWFPTGDVATIDEDGYMQITDRSKDVIKSGGEWISSIDLENVAVGHPAVAEAAVIGVPHPKWDERPLLLVVKTPGVDLQRDEMLKYFEGRIAKWWIPDDVVFVDQLPHTATGKLLKTKLRDEYRQHALPTVVQGSRS